MRIERSGTVYEHDSRTAPVQPVCDTRIIDIYHACCCHNFTLSFVNDDRHLIELIQDVLDGKSKRREDTRAEV
jgi:hypothetical protein